MISAITAITEAAPWLLLGAVSAFLLARYGITPRLLWASPELRRSLLQAAHVRRSWPRLARHLGLVLVDRTPTDVDRSEGRSTALRPRVRVPRIRVRADEYGVVVTARTLPGVGLDEYQKRAPYLSDAWRAVRVAVSRPAPGRVVIRAVRRDPLVGVLPYEHEPQPPATLRQLPIGVDEYGEPVTLRLDGVSGIGVYGLPGYGKTSLINRIILPLMYHPAVQFAVLDGKGGGDYEDIRDRCLVVVGDDLDAANGILRGLVEHRRERAERIRSILGVRNFWHREPSPAFPLLVVVVDEAHTYFEQVRDGGDKALRARNALAAQNALYVQDLVKKGRSVGMVTILATQKGTGDAIPTAIRDVCAVSVAFACRTEEAAVAALGADIRNYPDAHPITLQDPAYIGVATMVVAGRQGFTRFRVPNVPEDLVAASALETASLAIRPAGPVFSLPGLPGAPPQGLPAGGERSGTSDMEAEPGLSVSDRT